MHQAAVANEQLRRFHQPLRSVDRIRLETSHEEEVHEQIDVSAHRLSADFKAHGISRRIVQPALSVSQHRPESTKRLGGDTRAKEGNVSFKTGPDQVVAPGQAQGIALCKEAVGKSAPQPQRVFLPGFHLEYGEGRQFQVADAAGQALAALSQELDRRRLKASEPCSFVRFGNRSTARKNGSRDADRSIATASHCAWGPTPSACTTLYTGGFLRLPCE